MKTSNINVHDMLSVWSVEEVEKHISEVPGVESVTLNYDTGHASVRYDETRLDVADIKSAVRQRSYESFAQEHSSDKPAEEKNEATATPSSAKPPEGKDKPETNPPAKTENPDVTPPTGTIVKPEKEKEDEKSTVVKPPQEKDEPETKPTAIGEKKEEDSSSIDNSKMDHSTKNNGPTQHGAKPSMGMEEHNHPAMIADYKKRFFVVLILTVPIVLLSTMIQKFIGVNWQFTGSPYILFALSSVVFFYGGWPFLKGWLEEIKAKNPGMFFLIGFAKK